MENWESLFADEVLKELLPQERVQAFFEAFYFGEEPAYDLELGFGEAQDGCLIFELRLKARPGQCLRCNLTWGLPQIMAKHPQLNLAEVVKKIEEKLPEGIKVTSWNLGLTEERNPNLHVIPLVVRLNS